MLVPGKYTALLCGALSLGAAGCATWFGAKDTEVRRLTPDQLNAFYARAQDPRRYGLNLYPSADGPMFLGGNRVHRGQVFSETFRTPPDVAAPVVLVRGRGPDTFPALIDTSSAKSWVSLDTGLHLGAVPDRPPADKASPLHVDDDIDGYLCISPKLRFEQFHVETVLLYVRGASGPLGPLARDIERPQPSMVVGYDLLNAFNHVQVDYPNRTLVLSASTDYTAQRANLMVALPMRVVAGALAVDGVVDGKPGRVILDTAGDFSLAVPGPVAETITQVSLGDLVFREVSCVDSRRLGAGLADHPRAGRQLLSRYKITLDNKRKVIYFERPGTGDSG